MARSGARKRPRGRTARREPRKRKPAGESTEQAPRALFPVVVGMGASAGGLEAFTRFFRTMPPDSGMAFVVIQHLDPTHESLTAELLGKHTKMPVRQVAGDTAVERDHVYVIPPNRDLGIGQGVLRLTPPPARRPTRMPIDFFFRTLAEDRQERAIGIILSGSGTDGTLGLKEIRTVGGIALVQDPTTAQHDGMPRSAIAADAADHVLPVEKMPEILLQYSRHSYVAVARHAPAVEEGGADDLTGVLALLRTRLHFDFSGYKPGTLVRRVRRRMGLRHVERLPDYLQILRSDPGEVKALFKDLLIGVTRFFRDPEAWHYLEEKVLPSLLREREAGAPLRVWVAGCGTGEEAYSLGMLLIEQSHAAQWSGPIQIFASDVDKEALDIGRTGIYPGSIAADVPAAYLRRFFVKDGNHYRVSKELREAIIFAEQNLIADPPFSKLDLISCRNLLIYLSADVQKRVIALLHFALVEGGHLFLGSAESIGSADDLFDTVSKRWRIYRRIGPTRYGMLALPATAAHGPILEQAADPLAPPRTNRLLTRVQQQLLERYAPAGVVINRRYEIQLFVGRTDRYLTQPAGAPTDDLLTRVREGLQTRLRALVRQVITDHEAQTVTVRIRRDNAWHRIRIAVEPLHLSGDTEGLLLVSFADEVADVETKPVPAPEAASPSATERDESLVRQLEAELKASREDLQGTIAGMEASNEELRAANEEVMSVNEELQSTNEELETSKEELQSLNEELNTVNAQLQSKIEEVERTNNDLDNLLTSTNIATVFLDGQLRIRRFTAAATRLFTLIPSDIGRPLADITQTFTDPALLTDVAAVLKTLAPRQAEVAAREGRWYMRQVLPYRTQDDRIEGVVITFSDVAAETLLAARADLEAALNSLTASEARLRTTLDTAADAIITIDESGRVHSFNRTAEKMFGYGAAEVIGKNVSMLMPPPYSQEHDSYLARYRETGVARLIGIGREVEGLRKDGTRVPLDLAVSEFTDSTGRKFTGILRDLTERKQAVQWRREHESQLAHMLRANTAGEAAASLAHQLNQPLAALGNDIATCQARLGARRAPGVRALLKHAMAEAQRAGAILRRFRDMIRKKPPQLDRADLRDIIRDAGELMRPEMARHHVAFDLRLPTDPLPVRVDRVEIEQVILNLMQNALDAVHTGSRRGQIGVRAIRRQATRDVGELARVSVEDNGPGIPAEAADRLFEPFFTTKKGGLGMGLPIARTLVEAHRGRIWVERRPRKQGAVVRFTLPLHTAPEGRKGGDGRVHRIRRRR
jgi:two-component system, chemotaxis family, CheB/CheR fusion protein